ncbi:MAG: DUF4214 domain-containing protein [Pseudomonadales bacterium]|nr:DUF4214 domain-containing protein [Pseudomonadales bacterium]
MASQQYLDTVQKAYIAYYGRPADYSGLNYWSSELEKNNGHLSAIFQQFGNSNESRSLYSSSTHQEQVKLIYRQLFNREPDIEGENYWVNALQSGEITIQSFALSILNGASGSDATLIDKKLEIAQLFTDTLHSYNADHIYRGENDAEVLREMLAQVTTATTTAIFMPVIEETIDAIHDDPWVEYDEQLDFILSNGDALVVGFDQYTGSQIGRDRDIFLSKINGAFEIENSVLIGDSKEQSLIDLAISERGNVLITGLQETPDRNRDSFIVNLNEQFEVVGAVQIGSSLGNDQINAVTTRSDSKVVAVGYEYSESDAKDAYIVILNEDMSIYAQRRVDNSLIQNSDEEFYDVISLSDNSLVVNSSNILLKFDSELNLIKTVEFSRSFDHLVELSDGTILAKGYSGHLYQFDHNLNLVQAWTLDFSYRTFEAYGDKVIFTGIGSDDAVLTVEVDYDSGEISAIDAKQISSRSGSTIDTNAVVILGSQAILHNTYYSGTNKLYSINPQIDSQPNLSSDYRVYELDESLYNFTEMEPSNYYYPDETPLVWEAHDINIVGSLEFSALSGAGILQIDAHGTLSA